MTFEGYSNDVAFRLTRRCRILCQSDGFLLAAEFLRPERCESLAHSGLTSDDGSLLRHAIFERCSLRFEAGESFFLPWPMQSAEPVAFSAIS
jgi:hypothetical protein